MTILAIVLSIVALVVSLRTAIDLRLGIGAVVNAMRRSQGLPPTRPGENPLDAIENPSRRVTG